MVKVEARNPDDPKFEIVVDPKKSQLFVKTDRSREIMNCDDIRKGLQRGVGIMNLGDGLLNLQKHLPIGHTEFSMGKKDLTSAYNYLSPKGNTKTEKAGVNNNGFPAVLALTAHLGAFLRHR